MNAELMMGVARRAEVHAALGDPARLLITDTLLAGDAYPSELAAMLTMPSNLLANHLQVLEQAGVITRRRSEGTGGAVTCG
jgi:DNA-binding transcriptional ArsR family regulator